MHAPKCAHQIIVCTSHHPDTKCRRESADYVTLRPFSISRSCQPAVLVRLFHSAACRYFVTEQWVAKKLEVLVDVPEQVDLEWLRGSGPQPHEQLQPEEPTTSSQAGGLSALAAAAGTQLFLT